MWRKATGSPWLPVAVLAVLGAGGCAAADETLQRDVAQLRQDLSALTLAVHRARTDADTAVGQIDRRTRDQAAESSRQVAAVTARVDAATADLGRLSARLEELSVKIDALTRQLAGGAPAAPPPAAAPTITPAPPPGGTAGAEQAYQAAYLDFSKGNFPLAISGFREFVRRFPDAPIADKAQYWVGESYFSMARASAEAGRPEQAARELEQAVQEFRRVIVNYPRGEKAPTALYKEALALLELRQPRLAQTRLRYLLDHFPQSEEAPLARERLANIPG